MFGAPTPNNVAQTCDLGTQDWETGSNANPPDGWVRIGSPNQANPFAGEMRGRAIGLNAEDEGIQSPELTCVGTVTFNWHASSANAEHTVELQWTQTPNDGSSWQTFNTVVAPGNGNSPRDAYVEVVADLPEDMALAPFGIYVRWVMTQRTSSTFYLDDICFTSGTCSTTPTQVTFTELPATCIEAGAPFTVVACATDANGFVAEDYSGNIAVLPSSGTVQGGGAGPSTNGCRTITLTASTAGDFDLLGTAMGLTAATASLTAEADCPSEIDVRVLAYNLLNFPNGRAQCQDPDDIVLPNRQDTLAKIIEFVQPDVLMVCELQTQAGSDAILQAMQGVNADYRAAQFVPNTSSIVQDLNNMLYYNSAKMTLVSQSVIPTGTRDISRYRMQMNDPRIATAPDTVFVDFFVAHTKAGSAPADSTRRANDLATFQAAFESMDVDNAIIGGDMNFYTSTEAAYQTLLGSTVNPWFDPVDSPGDWDNNPVFADLHTQSSRQFGVQSYDCGISGGIDSRFDFILHNGPVETEALGVRYLPGTYEIPGNNGMLFNDAINDAGNSSGVPREVLNAMFFMSDHLPVRADYRVTFPEQDALPVELLVFEVGEAAGAKQVGLDWSVSDESGFDYYGVERLTVGSGWEELGRVAGDGRSRYAFADLAPAAGVNYYRLRLVDLDGSVGYSSVRSVRFGGGFSVYPTVSSGLFTVRGAERVTVLDGFGRPVGASVDGAGRLDLRGLAGGWYVLLDGFGGVRRVFLR